MIRLGVLFGGRSGEHEISLMSATSVINAIDRDKYEVVKIGITREGEWYLFDGPAEDIENGSWEAAAKEALSAHPDKYRLNILGTGGDSLKNRMDFALPILHGPYGEDGTIQGLFEMTGIPYGGSGVTGSALTMDKILAKAVFGNAGLPQGPYVAFTKAEYDKEGPQLLGLIEKRLSYPLFVKPANMGSSVGINKVRNCEELKKAIEEAAIYDNRLLAEEGIDCRELEVAVLGNSSPEVSGVGEIIPSREFYDYTAKYFDDGKSLLCIPADISEDKAREIRLIAAEAYKLLDCSGYARVDCFMEKSTGKILLNEINTIPGFTKYSMFPLLWGEAGISYKDLIERIVGLGYERYNAKNSR
ncbi:D-alanine--D-alanine ligase [Bacillota bacterium]